MRSGSQESALPHSPSALCHWVVVTGWQPLGPSQRLAHTCDLARPRTNRLLSMSNCSFHVCRFLGMLLLICATHSNTSTHTHTHTQTHTHTHVRTRSQHAYTDWRSSMQVPTSNDRARGSESMLHGAAGLQESLSSCPAPSGSQARAAAAATRAAAAVWLP